MKEDGSGGKQAISNQSRIRYNIIIIIAECMRPAWPIVFTYSTPKPDSDKQMSIQFTKMHGLGNDFMVIDGINQTIKLTPEYIRTLGRRDTGVGFDQCLLVESSKAANVDFNYRIFNADGQEVGQCGNGARCLARFLRHYKLTNKNTITVATPTTQMTLTINADQSVTVNMGKPHLNPSDIPLKAEKQCSQYTIPVNSDLSYDVHAINVGNPHAVLVIPDADVEPVEQKGRMICTHPLFPEQVNVGFMQIKNSKHVKLRVYERGCGETQACGSGAVAAAAIGRLYHGLDETVQVDLPGGSLTIQWPDFDSDIYLTGPAAFVYEGRVMDI